MEEGSGSEWLDRTRLLLGDDAVDRLQSAKVYVFGLGAVGSYAVEGLVRSGIGFLRLVDFDLIKPTNRNRQLYSLESTNGLAKTEVAAARAKDINPDIAIETRAEFAHAETLPRLLDGQPDLVIDAIDSLAPKTELIAAAAQLGMPVFSALGAATRQNADAIRFAPLFDAVGCPLGRLIRKRLRRRGVEGDLWCVYSSEPRNSAAVAEPEDEEGEYKRGRSRTVLGSMATITGMYGLRLAHEAVLRLSRGGKEADGAP